MKKLNLFIKCHKKTSLNCFILINRKDHMFASGQTIALFNNLTRPQTTSLLLPLNVTLESIHVLATSSTSKFQKFAQQRIIKNYNLELSPEQYLPTRALKYSKCNFAFKKNIFLLPGPKLA